MPQAVCSRVSEIIKLDDGKLGGGWFICNNNSYDVTYTRDLTDDRGRLHHVTFAVDQNEHIPEAPERLSRTERAHRGPTHDSAAICRD